MKNGIGETFLARTKQVTDEQIIAAAVRCVVEIGPPMRLADVAERVGLSAATVVQRFGTKRNLMREVAKQRLKRVQAVDYQGPGSPVDRIVEGWTSDASWLTTREQVANYAAVRHTDLADPEFKEVIKGQFQRQRMLTVRVLEEAITEGELRPCDTEVVARLLYVTLLGAHHSWAIDPAGEFPDWVAHCLRRCLAPWMMTDEDRATAA